ncbi:hypothetical protein C0J52_08629 [Blattella germanica]|nr:hypothetical protein C0J52_08629 [Blattella germanica]
MYIVSKSSELDVQNFISLFELTNVLHVNRSGRNSLRKNYDLLLINRTKEKKSAIKLEMYYSIALFINIVNKNYLTTISNFMNLRLQPNFEKLK